MGHYGLFFSIDPWQEVQGINPRLAGIDLYGHKLLIPGSGLTCPVWDVQGRLIGWQTRFDNAESGKYKWPTSRTNKRPNGATAHLQNGELPLGCYRPVDGVKLNSIGLAEGFLKPYVAAQIRGQIFIGAAGGNLASSPEQFKTYLAELSAELGTNIVDLYPDAGAIANNAVMGQYERAIQMVREWGYKTRVAWWGQVDKSHPDIDELPSDQEIAYLTSEEFFQMGGRSSTLGRKKLEENGQPPLIRVRVDQRGTSVNGAVHFPTFTATAHSFAGLLGWLPRFKRWIDKWREPWGIGLMGEVEVEPTPPQRQAPKYDAGERLDVYSAANHLGYKYVLDTSGTGSGKSFDAGRLTPELFPEARQIIYVSNDHRNVTTPTLECWPDLEARHDGLYRDEFGKLRRVKEDQRCTVPPNCGRNATIGALRAKNLPGADTADLICRTCPHFEPCRAGAVFGYLNQRADVLKQPRLRAHPDSLPSPDDDYDYQHTVLVIEEASEILQAHRSIEVTADDVSRTIADLMTKLPDAFDALRPLLTSLLLHISGEIKQPNKYGWGDAQIRAALPAIGELDLEAISIALLQHPERLIDTTKEHGTSSADLPRGARVKLAESDRFTAKRVATQLALNWLPDFLDILLGNQVGSLNIQYDTLTITLQDERLQKIAQKAGCNIFLDATADPGDIARALGINSEEILVVEQATEEFDNLEIIQVATMGRLGIGSRRKNEDGEDTFLQKRVDALIAKIDEDSPGRTAAIDFKSHSKAGDGKSHWWVGSRGVNDLENCDTLILVGVPCRNLNSLKAEFTVLYGRAPKEGTECVKYSIQINGQSSPDLEPWFEMDVSADPEFRAFVRRKILADIHQAIGRLRAHRRRGKKLKVYLIGDYPLDIPVTLTKASDITPEAATKMERFVMALKAGIEQLKATGQKVTQTAIAAITGYSQQYISKHKDLLLMLLDGLNSKSSKNSQPPPDPGESPPDPGETEWMSQQHLPRLADSPPAELLAGVMDMFEVYGKAVFKRIWDAAPATAQLKIMQTLLLTLPAGELRSLALAVGINPSG